MQGSLTILKSTASCTRKPFIQKVISKGERAINAAL
jgi:hypothetical protein